ncbi:MAG: hypothetical protein WC683_01345 [bacterium]
MGEAKWRRAHGIGSRTEERREREQAEVKRKAQEWWDSLTPEEQEAERVRRKRGRKLFNILQQVSFAAAGPLPR